MSAQHTRGPWSVGIGTGCVNQIAIEPVIGCVYGTGDEVIANARLVAAAPDLLSVVERVEALLTRQKWKDYGFGAEAQILHDARTVLTKIHGDYES